MKKATIVLLLAAVLLITVGVSLFIFPLATNGWDFSMLKGNRYQTKSYEITEEFNKVTIDVVTSDVIIFPSTDGKVSVISNERIKESNEVAVKDGTLSVKFNDTGNWYDKISLFDSDEASIKIYLPIGELDALNISVTTGDVFVSPALTFGTIDIDGTTGDVDGVANTTGRLRIHLTTGDVYMAGIRAGEIVIENTTGDIELERIDCAGAMVINTGTGEIELSDSAAASLTTEGTTGELELMRVSLGGALTVNRASGDVSFRMLDAGSIDIDCTTGDVIGSVVKPMMFFAHTTTGDVRIPTPEAGGACRIETTTGDIRVTIE